MSNGWIERPKCNVNAECTNPSIIMIGTKYCCSEHLMKIYKKQQEAIDKMMAEL